MEMNVIKIALAGMLALSLAACEGSGTKQTLGTLLGGVGGAVAGAQFGSGKGQLAATAAGALLGAFVGSEVGKSLDNADRAAMQRAEEQATLAPVGKTVRWDNPDSGNYGSVTPTREGRHTTSGEYCREFQQSVTIGGDTEQAVGTACQNPDGTWRII